MTSTSTTRTMTRRLAGLAATAGAVALTTTALAAPAQAASLCATDCISSISVASTTSSISATVRTTGYTHVTVEIWNAAGTARLSTPNVAAGTLYWGNVFSFKQSSYLSQNTYYQVRATATDMLGKKWTETRSIRVKQRNAVFTISRIDLQDDSDYAGAGEFRAGWKAAGATKSLWSGLSSKSSGGYWTFGSGTAATTISVTKVAATPKVFLELSDDDRDAGDPCGTGGWVPTFGGGSNTCADWATAGITLNLPEYSTTQSFTLQTAKNAVVKFKVTGKVVVTVS
jgi:hypothetical protein